MYVYTLTVSQDFVTKIFGCNSHFSCIHVRGGGTGPADPAAAGPMLEGLPAKNN